MKNSDFTTNAVIYGMLTDDLVNPQGIDSEKPVFSWKTKANANSWLQSAYEIKVFKGDDILWDSGKVESGVSVGVVYNGKELEPSTKYEWCVTVWDKDGCSFKSDAASFKTGLPKESPFGNAKWISYDWAVISKDTKYAIDFNFIIERVNAGFCFGMKDKGSYFVWQISAEKDGKLLLKPQIKESYEWTSNEIPEADVTDAVGLGAEEVKGKVIFERIEVDGKAVRTYLGKDLSSLTLVHEYWHDKEIPLYNIGFRQCGPAPSYTAIASYADIRITDSEGKQIYKKDFAKDNVGFRGSSLYSVSDGRLKVGSFHGNCELVYISSEGKGLPVFRKTLSIKKGLVEATLYTSGLGVYEAYLNGERVGKRTQNGLTVYDELKPGFTETRKRRFYNSYDVTEMLVENKTNVLTAVVSHGWWSDGSVSQYYEEDAFLSKLILKYTDGTSEVIDTDETWKSEMASPVVDADIFSGETYDARIDSHWNSADFDDSSWSFAKENKRFNGVLCAWKGSPIVNRKDLELKAKSITVYSGAVNADENRYGKINVVSTVDGESFVLNPGEKALIDFGQNFSGRESFSVKGERGTNLTVRHGEMLNDNNGDKSRGNDGPEGSIYNLNYRSAKALTKYVLSGEGTENYSPIFSFYGFRYIEISVDKSVTLSGITGQVITSVEKETGELTTSDASINQLISNIRWGQYSNYLSVPTDCPQRDERQGWTADTQIFAKAGCYLAFSKSFLSKFMFDMRDSQNEAGAFPGTSPTGRYYGGGWGATGWADAGVIIPRLLYTLYGDKSIITDSWDSMVRYVDGFLSTTNGIGPKPIYGDWLAYESNDEGVKEMLGIAFYAWDALLLSEMADIIGKTSDAEKYRALYEKEKQLFITKYLTENKTLCRGEQSVCAYALYLDLLPDQESFKNVSKQLTDNIERNGNKLQTGFLGTAILLPTLTKIGRNDLAYSLLLQHDNPSWLYSVDQGATTIWERWNSYTLKDGFGDVGMNSFNHYAYGAVAAWMFETMAGIAPDGKIPAFKKINFTPKPDRRLAVKASYDSAYGLITAQSEFEGELWKYSITVPSNTTAKITVPTTDLESVAVNGKSLSQLTKTADGIAVSSLVGNTAVLDAVSGSFEITANI